MCETPDLFEERKRTARKTHRCCECLADIRMGSEYMHIAGLWEGEWLAFKMCFDCYRMRAEVGQQIEALGDCACLCYTELVEYLHWNCPEHRDWILARQQRYWQHRAEREQRRLCLRW